jgi:hypothetical protein
MTEVLFPGERIEKSHANLILARESNPNTPEYKRRVEEQERKKQEQEQQKQQEQKQKRSESRLKEKKVEEYFHKYRQENYPPDVQLSEELGKILWQRARNAVDNERRHEEYLKQYEEEQRKMAEREKSRKEQREREAIARRELPERQLQMFLSGKHDYMEPGLKLLAEEFRTGKIIKRLVGEQAYSRLVEFAKPDETWEVLMNRLLDIASAAK